MQHIYNRPQYVKYIYGNKKTVLSFWPLSFLSSVQSTYLCSIVNIYFYSSQSTIFPSTVLTSNKLIAQILGQIVHDINKMTG